MKGFQRSFAAWPEFGHSPRRGAIHFQRAPSFSINPDAEGGRAIRRASWAPKPSVRPRKDHRGGDLISDALPFGRLWYDAIGYAMHSSRSHDAVIRVYDDAGNVIEMHEHKGDFKEA